MDKKNSCDIYLCLIDAVEKGDTATVETLLADGAEVDTKGEDGWTALMVATAEGDKATVQALLDKGAKSHTHTIPISPNKISHRIK